MTESSFSEYIISSIICLYVYSRLCTQYDSVHNFIFSENKVGFSINSIIFHRSESNVQIGCIKKLIKLRTRIKITKFYDILGDKIINNSL